MAFLDDLRQELIDDGDASKFLLDYIDQRIETEVAKQLDHRLPQVEENLRELLQDLVRRRGG